MGRTAEKRETPEQRWEEPRVLAGYGQIEGLMPGMTGVVDPDDLAECRRRRRRGKTMAPSRYDDGSGAGRRQRSGISTTQRDDGGVAVGRQQNDDRTASDPRWIRKAAA